MVEQTCTGPEGITTADLGLVHLTFERTNPVTTPNFAWPTGGFSSVIGF